MTASVTVTCQPPVPADKYTRLLHDDLSWQYLRVDSHGSRTAAVVGYVLQERFSMTFA